MILPSPPDYALEDWATRSVVIRDLTREDFIRTSAIMLYGDRGRHTERVGFIVEWWRFCAWLNRLAPDETPPQG